MTVLLGSVVHYLQPSQEVFQKFRLHPSFFLLYNRPGHVCLRSYTVLPLYMTGCPSSMPSHDESSLLHVHCLTLCKSPNLQLTPQVIQRYVSVNPCPPSISPPSMA